MTTDWKAIVPQIAQQRNDAQAEAKKLRDALALLRGYVPMGSEGWDIINGALAAEVEEPLGCTKAGRDTVQLPNVDDL